MKYNEIRSDMQGVGDSVAVQVSSSHCLLHCVMDAATLQAALIRTVHRILQRCRRTPHNKGASLSRESHSG